MAVCQRNPCHEAKREYTFSVKVTAPHVKQIEYQLHQLSDEALVMSTLCATRSEQVKEFEDRVDRIKEVSPQKLRKGLELASGERSVKVANGSTVRGNRFYSKYEGVPRRHQTTLRMANR